ncbi:MAG: glycosyltransferase [Lachnospiraceae bacterium]|nr:glycosyltransferase [Lachnospiraceae bacterium]
MQPLISVIVPVYNGQDYLEKCIESIQAQTYDNVEIIIVNDGSTDGTGQVCVRLKEMYSNIHIITMEDEGVSAARNAGLDAAKGAFVTFVDADDRIRPKMLEVLHRGIMNTGSDVCGCRFLMWKSDEEWKNLQKKHYRIESPIVYEPGEYLEAEVLNGNSRCWSKLYRRAAIGKLRFKRGLTIGEDMLFVVELLPYIRSISEIAYPGYGYYVNPKGAMNRTFTPRYMDQIACWEVARSKMPDKPRVQAKVTTILLVSIMLTVGKIAELGGKDRKKYKKYIEICNAKIKEEIKVEGAYEGLSKGYQIKVKFFGLLPKLYVFLYHFRKYKKA